MYRQRETGGQLYNTLVNSMLICTAAAAGAVDHGSREDFWVRHVKRQHGFNKMTGPAPSFFYFGACLWFGGNSTTNRQRFNQWTEHIHKVQ